MFADDLHSPQAIAKLVRGGVGVLAQEHLNPKPFGVLEADKNGRVIGVEEKPEQPKSNLVAVGVYVLDSTIFDYPMPISPRGEYEYTTPFQHFIKNVHVVVEKTDFWHPIGWPQDLEAAEKLLSEKYRITIQQKRNTPVIIIAGGKGTRMPDDEKDKPKCLVDISGKPMLQWQLEELRGQGFYDITLALGYKADMVIEWLENTGNQDVRYVVEREPLGTGGAMKLALGDRKVPFIGINCDDFADVNLTSLMRHSCGDIYNVVSVAHIADARTFGLIECDEYKKICRFREKDPNSTAGLVSVGHYYLQPDIFEGMEGRFMIEMDIFPKLADAGKLVLQQHAGYWVTANNAEQLKSTRGHFSKTHK